MGKNVSLIISSSSIQRAPPLLDPCCVGVNLEGGGSHGEGRGWLPMGRRAREGGGGCNQLGRRRGGLPSTGLRSMAQTRSPLWAPDPSGKNAKRSTVFWGMPPETPNLNATEHQRKEKKSLTSFQKIGVSHSTPLKKNSSSNSTTPSKASKVPHIAPPFKTWVHYWS